MMIEIGGGDISMEVVLGGGEDNTVSFKGADMFEDEWRDVTDVFGELPQFFRIHTDFGVQIYSISFKNICPPSS